MLYFLNVDLGAEYSRIFFPAFICQKITLPIDNLHVAVCSFGEYAMSLDHSIGHDSFKSREQNVSNKNVSNNKDKRL